jgi:hypothetical protein
MGASSRVRRQEEEEEKIYVLYASLEVSEIIRENSSLKFTND